MLPMLELPPPGPLPPRKGGNGMDGRVFQDHLRELRCLSRMAGKLMSWAAMVRPPRRPVSCCGKEALGHDLEEIDVQGDGAEDDAKHEELVAQNPAQAGGVLVVQPV